MSSRDNLVLWIITCKKHCHIELACDDVRGNCQSRDQLLRVLTFALFITTCVMISGLHLHCMRRVQQQTWMCRPYASLAVLIFALVTSSLDRVNYLLKGVS